MELRHLRYFVAVAEELHFGRAAERLFIAQPPLSQQIQQLEREIGVPLLERTSRRVQLTPAGNAFLDEARQILSQAEKAGQIAHQAARGEIGWLGVGFAASATYEALPRVLPVFRAQFPLVELRLYELTAAEQAQALFDKTIHIGFARPPLSDAHLVSESVIQEPFVVAMQETHWLSSAEAINLADLREEPFLTFPHDQTPSYAETVDALCAQAGFAPQAVQVVREMQTAISLVAAGLGVAILPGCVQNLQRHGVVYRTVHTPETKTTLGIVCRRDDPSPTLAAFRQVVHDLFSSHV